ncbi:MAG: T9SS type A sorting domain-containing protein [Flavobacteriales bacterium]|nr:T9SS type A sorting domain-containing protein [Flavobacteriales bacterium]
MKKIYTTLLAFSIAVGASAQFTSAPAQKSRLVDNTVALGLPTETPSVAATGDTINGLYWDFSDQNAWTFGNAGTPSANWEFTTTGPYGDFSESYGALESTTAANGWAMFDSDALGTGSSVQDAWVQLANSVDLTGYSSVAVSFQQYYGKFNGFSYLEVSTDGSTWTTFEVNGNQGNNSSTDNPDLVVVNISGAVAANPSTVWIRFRYEGSWDYFWQVDDVAIVEGATNDLAVTKVWHGDINAAFEYQQIPLDQAQEVVIGVASTNQGGTVQNNLVYDYDISLGGSSVASGSFGATNTILNSTSSDTTWYSTGYTPSALGTYTVTVTVSADETDELPSNDQGTSTFKVTNFIYAHDDEDNIEFQIYGGLDASDSPNEYKAAMYYEIFSDVTLTSVQTAFGANTTTSSCYVEVFDAVNDQSFSNPLVTEVYDLQNGDISSGANINLVNILLNDGDGIDLLAGGVYLISIGNTGAGEDLWILASDGDDDRAQLRYGPFGAGSAIDWYTGYTTSPMIRANTDPSVGITENEDVSGLSVYPNPTSDLLNVAFVSKDNQNITVNVFNVTGALVQTEQRTVKVGQRNLITFDTEKLSSGMYMVQLVGANSTVTEQVVVR